MRRHIIEDTRCEPIDENNNDRVDCKLLDPEEGILEGLPQDLSWMLK